MVAPTPRVEEEPIATIVSGLPDRIRDEVRSSAASIPESAGGEAQFGRTSVAVVSGNAGPLEPNTIASAAARSPTEGIAVIEGLPV
jgi:hypothetical protein